jgi:hypothetical protein
MKVTTFTPSGSAVITISLQQRAIDQDATDEVGTLAKQFDVPVVK